MLEGNRGKDTVCPTKTASSCATAFKFTPVKTATGLKDTEDGILGLWSGNSSTADKTEQFVPEMAKSGAITKKVFSFYLSGLSGRSYIDFGEPNTAVYKDASLYVSMPIKSANKYWTNTISGLRWKKNSNDRTEYKLNSADALTDSGSSCIIGPSNEIAYIRNSILN